MRERTRSGVLTLLLLAAPSMVAAQVPAGGEFQVNTSTTSDQAGGAPSTDDRGNVVVVWLSLHNGANVYGQRFDAAGVARGGEFQVNTYTGIFNRAPDVASAADGSFAVVWLFDGPTSTDSIHARRFNAAGAPVGQEFAGTLLRSQSPDVASDAAGNFVVAWHELTFTDGGRDILGQRYDSQARRLGSEFQANTYTTFEQRTPAVAADRQGNFVVVWRSAAQDGSGYGVFGQRFSASGAAVGSEFRVNSYTTDEQSYPAVATAADGRFVVVWASYAQDGSAYGIFGQRFSASATPLGAEFRVNTYTSGAQFVPWVASDAAGNFVVAWSSYHDGIGSGAFAQRFTAAGAPRGTEFRVNTTTAGSQFASGVASDLEGNLVMTWSSLDQDGSGFGVFARRFGGLLPTALAVNTTGNGVLEPGEVADVVPSWRNVNGAAQTVGGTGVSFTGPQPAVYQIQTAFANYSTVPNGATRPCLDCYRVTVPTTTRPLLHWDAIFDERITPDAQGQEKLWRVHLGNSFTDVPAANPFYRFVETLLHHSITGGCSATQYCPASSTAREQMAVFALVAREGAGYRPPACGTPVFADVPAGSPFCPFVEELARRGVVSGCGGGNYCPGAAVTREQMPVFVLRTLDPALDPPACGTPVFADVPASSPFCRWIEELARRGVVSGCGGGSYCPADPVTREQMGVFIAGTFGLSLYGP